jgi:neutral ceramidase
MERGPATGAVLCLSAVLTLGCATGGWLSVPGYKSEPAAPAGHLLVGAASVDITPAPGFPMGGHSIAGRFSRGHWMRLRARAFYFRDKEGSSLALVSCDLFAIPAGLQQMVASRLHHPKLHETTVADISRDNLIVVATHTHQGPANYMSNEFYNAYSSPYPGFNRELFDCLVEKIAAAVAGAAKDAADHPEGAELVVTIATVPTLLRNRAIEAFKKNPDSVKDAILGDGPKPPIPTDCRNPPPDICLRYGAVDPRFTVLAARRPDGAVAALLVFGAVHPTVLSHDVSFYSPDLAGFAMRELERSIVSWPRASKMVAGFFNGAEGDVSPRWNRRDIDEVYELGSLLAKSVGDSIVAGDPHGEGDSVRIRAVRRVAQQFSFCHSWPTPGVGTLGGAEDGRFVSFDMGWRAPHRKAQDGKPGPIKKFLRWLRSPNQGVKQPGFELSSTPFIDVTHSLAPPWHFPLEVPVTVVRLGSLALVAMPAELTTAMGREIRQEMAAILRSRQPIILGLANEYLEYVTTEKEYQAQEYEGGSTLFGPRTGKCYLDLLRDAAAELDAGASAPQARANPVPTVQFEPGPRPIMRAKFGPGYWGANTEYTDHEVKSPFATAARMEPDLWPRFEWREEKHEDKRVVLWTKQGNVWSVEEDDDGPHPALATFLANGRAGKRTWSAVWFPRAGYDESAIHVFEVETRDGASCCSEPFTIGDIRAGRVPLPVPASTTCPP